MELAIDLFPIKNYNIERLILNFLFYQVIAKQLYYSLLFFAIYVRYKVINV